MYIAKNYIVGTSGGDRLWDEKGYLDADGSSESNKQDDSMNPLPNSIVVSNKENSNSGTPKMVKGTGEFIGIPTKNIIIGALLLIGGFIVYKKYFK